MGTDNVTLTLLGIPFTLKRNADTERIREAVDYVQKKFDDQASRSRTAQSKEFLLSFMALDLADELLLLRKRQAETENRLARLLEYIDSATSRPVTENGAAQAGGNGTPQASGPADRGPSSATGGGFNREVSPGGPFPQGTPSSGVPTGDQGRDPQAQAVQNPPLRTPTSPMAHASAPSASQGPHPGTTETGGDPRPSPANAHPSAPTGAGDASGKTATAETKATFGSDAQPSDAGNPPEEV